MLILAMPLKAALHEYVCGEIDLNKPLVPKMSFYNSNKPVEYEGLNQICFKCGRSGHKDVCPFMAVQEACMNENGHGAQQEDDHGGQAKEPEAHSGDFGPWMLVQRRSRRGNSQKGKKDEGAGLYQ